MKKTDLDLRGETRGQIKTTCPLCSHTRKKSHEACLSVNLDEGGYTCYNCGEVGKLTDVISSKAFVAKDKDYKRPDVERLTRWAEKLDDDVLEYFHNRGISDSTLVECQISYGAAFRQYDFEGNPVTVDGIPQFDKGILFPFFENGELVWTKNLRPKEWCADGQRKIKAYKDGKPIPWRLDSAGARIVITEGEIDAMSWMEAGIKEVWSIPNGTKAFGWLSFQSVVERLLSANDIYLALDADEDGTAMRYELIRRLTELVGAERLNVISYPEDCKDANDVLVKHGADALKKCFSDYRPVPIDGISEVDEFSPLYLDYYRNGLPRGLETGIPGLDEIYRVMEGMVTIITGVTNYGKSEFVDELIRLQIELHNARVAFYTPENYPYALHMIKVAEKYIGKPFDKDRFGHMSEDEAIQAKDWMNQNMFYVNPRNQTFSVDEILSRAKVMIYRYGITGLVIDPWNYVRKDFNGLREDQFINDEMQKLVVFSRATGVHVWIVVHPRTLKKAKDPDDGLMKIEVPTVMELSGGSKFGDNADFLLCIHRDPMKAKKTGQHVVTIYNQKSRYRPAAQQGAIEVEWEPFNGRFKEHIDPNKPAIVKSAATIFVPENDDAF